MQSGTQIRFIELCETRNWDNDYFFSFGYFFELTEYLLLLAFAGDPYPRSWVRQKVQLCTGTSGRAGPCVTGVH